MGLTIDRDVKRTQVWGRVFLMGPTGAGKSRGLLELGSRLFGGSLPIVLINTQPNQGRLYADRFDLAALIEISPDDYHPQRFIEALDLAEQEFRGGVIGLDTSTHEWYGTNGITQLASRFGDWAKARPLHQTFVDRIAQMESHFIATCRAKMKYEQAEVDGRQVVTPLGVGPMQDADFQYEFNLVGVLDRAHQCEWSGHVDSLEGTTSTLTEADAERVAEAYTGWLSQGEAPAPIEEADPAKVAELKALLLEAGFAEKRIDDGFTTAKQQNRGKLHPDYVAKQIEGAQRILAKKKSEAAAAAAEGDGEAGEKPKGREAASETAA